VGVEDEKTAFEHAWESNLMTSSTPLAFPAHLEGVEELAKWARKTICAHQVAIKGTQLIGGMMLGFFLPTFGISCMNLTSLLFSHHEFSKSSFGMTPKHHFGKLSFTKSLEVNESWQTCMMVALRHMEGHLVLKSH
jgi:hypothetical protein